MHSIDDIVILSGSRTAIGSFGGSLSGFSPAELGSFVASAAISQAGVEAAAIDHAVFGHIITTAPQDAYLARHIALSVGMAPGSAAFNVNRLCGSAVQSMISATQMLMLGDSQLALAGGAESMSRGAYLLPGLRTGLRMGSAPVTDLTLGILSDPFGSGHMGLTAERIAAQYKLSRQELDEFALHSQQKAAAAISAGHFSSQITPVTVTQGKNTCIFAQDEHPRPDTSLQSLATLKPAFSKEGIVTAGNSSGLNDGAAALVLTSRQYARSNGLGIRARLRGYSFAGVAPEVMGLGPIPAVQQLLKKTGLSVTDLAVIESNEAFAAQAIAVNRSLGLDEARVNPNGGAIALGHPVGATGSILIIKAMYELERIDGQFALVTMCIGGGQGIALLLERCS